MARRPVSPPAWAEWALMAALPVGRAESESGDLLEQYRDEQVPAGGQRRADWWYMRQVALVFARAYGISLVALIGLFVMGDVSNTYRLTGPVRIGPLVALGVILAASARGGWRTVSVRGGLFAGAVTSTLLWMFMAAWWMTTWYPFSLVQRVEPYWIDAWHFSAAPGETFTHWIFWDNVGATIMSGLVLNASGLLVGLIGGVVGSIACRRYGRS